jgi:hypothetical protein
MGKIFKKSSLFLEKCEIIFWKFSEWNYQHKSVIHSIAFNDKVTQRKIN